MNDLISRQAALDALGNIDCSDGIGFRALKYDAINDAVTAIKALPSAQPTLYGYDIKLLAFIASVMAKEGMSPEEAVTILRDVNRVIEIMLEDMKEMQENALKQTLKKPWEVGQDNGFD